MKLEAQRILIIGGVALLAVVAVLGWTRKPAEPAPAYAATVPGGSYVPMANPGPMGGPAEMGAPPPAAPVGNMGMMASQPVEPCTPAMSPSGYGSSFDTPRYVHVVRPAEPPPTQVQEADRTAPAPTRQYAVAPRHRGRSKAKSVAIVAGTAGVGAAMGAIAGGGKGAALGALAGGGAGYVYDRLTHNR